VIASVGRVLLALGISAWMTGAAVTVHAQTPQPAHGTIHLEPPPAPKPNSSNQLAAPPSAAPNSSIAAAAPQSPSLDEAFHTADQATPVVPVTPVQPKTVQGPISVQGPKSAGPSTSAYIAIPAPAAASYRAPNSQAVPQQRQFQPPNPGPPPAEIRDLATLSEPAEANAPQRSEQPGPERLAETAPASAFTSEIAGPVADGSTELATSPLDASTLNTASVAFGMLGALVAIGAVVVARRSRS
jgi:hypothetical protein